MNSTVATRLIELNREFYTRFGNSFSATRHRIQPGVRLVLETLSGDEDILDLGCGNGWFARELAQRGHSGSYLGWDFSLPMLQDAKTTLKNFPAVFQQVDLAELTLDSITAPTADKWSLITAFAVLHHIPSQELRIKILQIVHRFLEPDGRFIHSNWQFLNSDKLKSRIQDWSTSGFLQKDIEPNDYLLDWRNGGKGLRYVHHFDQVEMIELAELSGFQIKDLYYSDGETGNLGLYQVWKKIN